jgi:NAD(P)-dependent dehydrogenase (short-subunit alcohol dehydrogenase family)
MPRFTYRDKVALITGGSRGLGLAIAREICDRGGKVALIARDPNELARAKAELAGRGCEALPVPCDLLDRGQIDSAVRKTIEHFGGIDILINNAGIIEVGPLEHMTREDFERSMGVHFWAPFELTMRVIPEMRRRGGGRIVNISSIGGRLAVPHMAPYTTSKFALTGFSDAIRSELSRDNIYVTTATPGMMRTGSQIHARFKGDHAGEYRWFDLSSRVPFASISTERAARKIVAACRWGRPALIVPWSARLIVAANSHFPSLTGHVMKLVNRFLPAPVDQRGNQAKSGSDVGSP